MDTSLMNEVKPPQHLKTPRARLRAVLDVLDHELAPEHGLRRADEPGHVLGHGPGVPLVVDELHHRLEHASRLRGAFPSVPNGLKLDKETTPDLV